MVLYCEFVCVSSDPFLFQDMHIHLGFCSCDHRYFKVCFSVLLQVTMPASLVVAFSVCTALIAMTSKFMPLMKVVCRWLQPHSQRFVWVLSAGIFWYYIMLLDGIDINCSRFTAGFKSLMPLGKILLFCFLYPYLCCICFCLLFI